MKIKICGIGNLAAAKAAEEAGADFLGFIFYPPSHRYIAPEDAAAIGGEIRHCQKVGVFVDEPAAKINAIARLARLDFVQLHGHESAEVAAAVDLPVIKAFRWRDDFRAETANAYPADILLLDSFSAQKVGGTGETFAWQEAAAETEKLTKPFFIAGGISLANAGEAVRLFRPYGLDVSGSLEERGQKSPAKIRAFMEWANTERQRAFKEWAEAERQRMGERHCEIY